MEKHFILKFEQSAEQVRGPVLRVVGFISGKAMVQLLDVVDLSANPRSAKAGSVTRDIIDSLGHSLKGVEVRLECVYLKKMGAVFHLGNPASLCESLRKCWLRLKCLYRKIVKPGLRAASRLQLARWM